MAGWPALGRIDVSWRGLAPASLQTDFELSLAILAVERLVYSPTAGAYAAIQGYQRYDVKNLIASVNTLVFSVGALVAVGLGTGIVGVTVAFCAAHLLQGGAAESPLDAHAWLESDGAIVVGEDVDLRGYRILTKVS